MSTGEAVVGMTVIEPSEEGFVVTRTWPDGTQGAAVRPWGWRVPGLPAAIVVAVAPPTEAQVQP